MSENKPNKTFFLAIISLLIIVIFALSITIYDLNHKTYNQASKEQLSDENLINSFCIKNGYEYGFSRWTDLGRYGRYADSDSGYGKDIHGEYFPKIPTTQDYSDYIICTKTMVVESHYKNEYNQYVSNKILVAATP